MKIINKKNRVGVHSYVPELEDLYIRGKLTRRQFLRYATLLGTSLAGATTFLASCSTEEAPTATAEPAATAVPAATATPVPTEVPAGPIRGGTLRFGSPVMGIDHPARFSWAEGDAMNTALVIEYLTYIQADNIAVPMLLDSWSASDDLLTWTLNLRKDVTFSTGDPFVADDVVFTMNEWLNPDVGSSFLGMMSYLQPTGIEKKDDHTVLLHLDSPQIAVPLHLNHYPGAMLDHRTFEGDWLENPVGTGPFTLEEWTPGERAVLKARTDGKYWQNGADGKPLPYLDEIVIIEPGSDAQARTNALKGGQIDIIHPQGYVALESLQDDPSVVVKSVATSAAHVMRMRADMEPWSDVKVRNAVKLCQDREKLLKLAYGGHGIIGLDTHVSPVHPAFSPMEPTPFDPEGAKALLAEAGFPDGIDVTLGVNSDEMSHMAFAEALQQDAEAAGIRITINPQPAPSYWDMWTEFDFSLTGWSHRPLAVMTLPLAYACAPDGTTAPWNESRWCDQEFMELLNEAQGILDVDERRKVMADIQRIQVERGTIGIPFYMDFWVAHNSKVKGIEAHPMRMTDKWKEAWIDPAD